MNWVARKPPAPRTKVEVIKDRRRVRLVVTTPFGTCTVPLLGKQAIKLAFDLMKQAP